ncbi:MAG: hypothetical protein HKN23_07025 [Verrucomicrobiales bacterium]|nr:hypothetical protein [Verrucomicrobiales bacterium]
MRIISLIILTFAVSSCSVTRMSDVVPSTCGTDYGKVVIGDEKTSYAPIVTGKSCRSGHCGTGKVVGVQVYSGTGSKSAASGCGTYCAPAGHAFALGGTTLLDPYSTSAHFGLGGNVGLSGFSTLPYTKGLVSGSHRRPALVLNSAGAYGLDCGDCSKVRITKRVTSGKAVIETEQNYEIQK